MRVLQIVGGSKPPPDSRDNIFIHRQIRSLRSLIPEMHVIYAGLGSNSKDMLVLAKKLRQVIKVFQPHLIHSQYATMTGAVTNLLSPKIPVVVSFGGDDIYGSYRNEYSTRSTRTYLALRFSKYCAKKAACCVAKNRNMKEILMNWGAKRIEIIPNGVNLDLFKEMNQASCRLQLKLKNDIKYVAFAVRNNDYVKRRDLAERAVELCNQASSHKVELLLLQNVAPDSVPLYLNAADVVLLCSNHEGSPNIIKEALACNRPVVSADVGDVRERFSLVKGIFFVRHDPIEIAKSLEQALLLQKSDGRKYVCCLAEEIIARQLYELYESILQEFCF